MITLPNMGLVKWDEIGDFFSHEQLASNFQRLDDHDHTAGKGIQIPYGGLASLSVGSENLRESVFTAVGERVLAHSEEVASANTITVAKAVVGLVKISGTTEIKKITATQAGQIIVLKFASSLTVTKGENLKIKENMSATELDTLTLVCDGTNWFEITRSAN